MKLFVKQKKLSWNYEYEIFQDDSLIFKAKANRTIFVFLRRKAAIMDPSGRLVVEMAEPLLGRLIEYAALFGWLYRCPFGVTRNGEQIGLIRSQVRLFRSASARLSGGEYKLFGHTGNTYSVFREKKQIGRIEREGWKDWDGDRYHGEFSRGTDSILASLFVLFVDLVWHTDDTELWSRSYEKTISLGGTKEDKNWKPD